jgi:hypothetical protein
MESDPMAAAQECERALERLATRLAQVDSTTRARHAISRSVSVHVTDLDRAWSARLEDGLLVAIGPDDGERAQIRISGGSDDLIALIDGGLSLPAAWATGRIRIDAGPMDLLRLRALL